MSVMSDEPLELDGMAQHVKDQQRLMTSSKGAVNVTEADGSDDEDCTEEELGDDRDTRSFLCGHIALDHRPLLISSSS